MAKVLIILTEKLNLKEGEGWANCPQFPMGKGMITMTCFLKLGSGFTPILIFLVSRLVPWVYFWRFSSKYDGVSIIWLGESWPPGCTLFPIPDLAN